MGDIIDSGAATAELIKMGGAVTALVLFLAYVIYQNRSWQSRFDGLFKAYMDDSKASTAAISASTAAVNNNTSAIEKLTDECRRKA